MQSLGMHICIIVIIIIIVIEKKNGEIIARCAKESDFNQQMVHARVVKHHHSPCWAGTNQKQAPEYWICGISFQKEVFQETISEMYVFKAQKYEEQANCKHFLAWFFFNCASSKLEHFVILAESLHRFSEMMWDNC